MTKYLDGLCETRHSKMKSRGWRIRKLQEDRTGGRSSKSDGDPPIEAVP